MKNHRQDVHRDQNYKCLEGCELSYKKCAELRAHLKDVHNQSDEVEYLKFATNEEYTSWLRSSQENVPAGKYVQTTGITRTKTAERKYLLCPHSGKSKCAQSTENTQASIKVEGSYLRNSACTSQIIVTKNIKDSTYFVKYHKNHYGHEVLPQQEQITNIDTDNIVSMLMQSISADSQSTCELISTQFGQYSISSESELSTQHKKKSKPYVKCNICKKVFYYKKNLYAHMRHFHKIEVLIKKEPKFQCDHCKVKFIRRSDFNEHLKIFPNAATHDHSYNRTATKKSRIVCSYTNCQEKFITHVQLRTHLCYIHAVQIEFEVMTFDSKNEFDKWKTKMEQETLSIYIKNSGKKQQKQIYDCHRSYMCVKKKGKTQRAVKFMGSIKMNKACPSRLEVTFSKSQVSVIYWKTHCGHTTEIGRAYLDKYTKGWIAGKRSEAKSQGRSKIKKIKKSHVESATIDVNATEELSDSKWMVPSNTDTDSYLVQSDEQISCTNCALKCRYCTCSCLDNINMSAQLSIYNNLNEYVEDTNTNNVENELNQLTASIGCTGNNEPALTDNILLKKKLMLAIELCDKNTFDSENMETMLEQTDKLIANLNKRLIKFE